jgi:hypothetical protein
MKHDTITCGLAEDGWVQICLAVTEGYVPWHVAKLIIVPDPNHSIEEYPPLFPVCPQPTTVGCRL